MWINLRILFVTCVLVALCCNLCLLHKTYWVKVIIFDKILSQ